MDLHHASTTMPSARHNSCLTFVPHERKAHSSFIIFYRIPGPDSSCSSRNQPAYRYVNLVRPLKGLRSPEIALPLSSLQECTDVNSNHEHQRQCQSWAEEALHLQIKRCIHLQILQAVPTCVGTAGIRALTAYDSCARKQDAACCCSSCSRKEAEECQSTRVTNALVTSSQNLCMSLIQISSLLD